jgi:hypothetical protein
MVGWPSPQTVKATPNKSINPAEITSASLPGKRFYPFPPFFPFIYQLPGRLDEIYIYYQSRDGRQHPDPPYQAERVLIYSLPGYLDFINRCFSLAR